MLNTSRHGPLQGLRVVEFAGIGPGPFACMLLADMGADVLTLTRPGRAVDLQHDVMARGRTRVVLDLKAPGVVSEVLQLLASADVLVEGFRPGVMERLGLGPDDVARVNPKLVYARMTGWGQHGPLAHKAGHDINYIAITGALHAIGAKDGPPVPPLNLLGDYAGGSLYLVVGVLAALREAASSGRGQVVDAAITDGVLSLMSLCTSWSLRGQLVEERASNLLDGGAPYYGVFETADKKFVSIGSIEPQFFAELCQTCGVDPALWDAQQDRSRWAALRSEFERVFRQRTRAQWDAILSDADACFAPVLSLSEAAQHPHNVARRAFVEVNGGMQPAPAPRFSRTPSLAASQTSAEPIAMPQARARWA